VLSATLHGMRAAIGMAVISMSGVCVHGAVVLAQCPYLRTYDINFIMKVGDFGQFLCISLRFALFFCTVQVATMKKTYTHLIHSIF